MQNRYVGDVGDFGKYALLRRLCGPSEERRVRLGMVWCLFPNEGHNGDGRHIAYLDAADFQDLDKVLITALRIIIQSGQRDVSSILSGSILAPGTISCHEPVSPPKPCSLADRLLWRSAWVQRCFELTADCDLVFFDPDNGLEDGIQYQSITRRQGNTSIGTSSPRFGIVGDTLLIYHHLNRTAPAARQIQACWKLRLAAAFDRAAIVPARFSSWVIAGVLAGSPRRCSQARIGTSSRVLFWKPAGLDISGRLAGRAALRQAHMPVDGRSSDPVQCRANQRYDRFLSSTISTNARALAVKTPSRTRGSM